MCGAVRKGGIWNAKSGRASIAHPGALLCSMVVMRAPSDCCVLWPVPGEIKKEECGVLSVRSLVGIFYICAARQLRPPCNSRVSAVISVFSAVISHDDTNPKAKQVHGGTPCGTRRSQPWPRVRAEHGGWLSSLHVHVPSCPGSRALLTYLLTSSPGHDCVVIYVIHVYSTAAYLLHLTSLALWRRPTVAPWTHLSFIAANARHHAEERASVQQ